MDIDPNLYLQVLTNPREVFRAQKANSKLESAAVNFAIAGFLGALVVLIISIAAIGIAFDPMKGAGDLIGGIIGGVIGGLVGAGIIRALSGLFGGTGKWHELAFLQSLFAVPLLIISGLIDLPLVGFWIALLAALYGLYLMTITVQEVESLNLTKSVIVVLIPVIIYLVIISSSLYTFGVYAPPI